MPFSSVALFRLLYFMEIWGSYKEIRSHQCQLLSTAEHSWMTHLAARPVPLLSLITQFWFSSTLACLCYMSVSPIGWDDISWVHFLYYNSITKGYERYHFHPSRWHPSSFHDWPWKCLWYYYGCCFYVKSLFSLSSSLVTVMATIQIHDAQMNCSHSSRNSY